MNGMRKPCAANGPWPSMGEAAIRSAVKGFLVAELHDEATGMSGLRPAEFEKVRQGYACARCLAEFFHYMAVCPVCGLERDIAADIRAAPQPWLDRDKELAKPTHKTRVATAEDALAHLALPANAEQIPLKGLRPSKWGRG